MKGLTKWLFCSLVICAAVFAGCGNPWMKRITASLYDKPVTPDDPAGSAAPVVTGVTVSPMTADVGKGGAQQFTAVVHGTGSPAQTVIWSIEGVVSSETTIFPDGLLTVAIAETATSLTVQATSTVDPAVSGTADVTVSDLSFSVTSVTINPMTASVVKGGTQQFSAVVNGTGSLAQTVDWSVEGGVSSGTVISLGGLLTVDAAETAPGLTVRATSTVDPAVSGTAAVTIPAISVSFNANNGSGTIAPIGGVTGESITLPVSGFTRGGKILDSWNTAADGTGTSSALGASYTIGSGSVTLYAVWTWPAGAGTSSADPYLIYDTAALREIDVSNDLDSFYKLESDITLEGTWYSLTTNEGLQFDGGGHTISFDDVTITGPIASPADEPGWGLFSTVAHRNAKIKNLKIEGSINAERTDGGRHFYLGGIVGYMSGATIENCVSTVEVTANGGYAGGIAGGMHPGCYIRNCYATGPVSASGSGQNFSYAGIVGAGGIVGLGRGSATYCYAENTVSASEGTLTHNAFAGGIWGENWGGAPANCAALNPSLSASGSGTLTTHRIGGTDASNYGRDDMQMYQNASPYTWTSGGDNGTDVAMSDVESEAWWSALFGSYWGGASADEDRPWKWDPGQKRPILWFE